MDPTNDGRLGHRRGALWWMGWHPLSTVLVGGAAGLALGNALAIVAFEVTGLSVVETDVGFAFLGVVAGVVGWYRGTGVVNRHFERVLDSFRAGVRLTGDDVITYALLGDGSGSKPLIEPSRRYDATFLVARPDLLAAYDGTLALDSRRRRIGESIVALPYEYVDSIVSEPSATTIETTEGDRFAFAAASSLASRALSDRVEVLRDGSGSGQNQPGTEDDEQNDARRDDRPAQPSR